jgi:hypothetical protein
MYRVVLLSHAHNIHVQVPYNFNRDIFWIHKFPYVDHLYKLDGTECNQGWPT